MRSERQPDAEIHLLFDIDRVGQPRDYFRIGLGSILVNLAAFAIFVWLWSLGTGALPQPVTELAVELRRATHLTEPPIHVSQPNTIHSGVTKKIDLQALQAHERQSPPPAPRHFRAPVQQSPKPQRAAMAPPPPPKIEATNRSVTPPPGLNVVAPPPRIQPEEPKLALETPGQGSAPRQNTATMARIAPPSESIQEALHNAARSSSQNVDFGEMEVQLAPVPPQGMGSSAGRLRSAIAPQILSDTHGVDFRPYLIRVLTAVRKNWQAVIPESARLGRRGVTTLQFIIARDGQVPRLVISVGSGTDAFDRAAVAGVSASNPFPPLPSEYPGNDLRLQLVFTYNMPRQ